MTDRFTEALGPALSNHPHSANIEPEAVLAEFDLHNSLREWNVKGLTDEVFAGQVAQAVDRVAIRKGLTEERFSPVEFHGTATVDIKTAAFGLKGKKSFRQAGLADADNLVRIMAAIVEVMSLSRERMPALTTEKGQQIGSKIIFKEITQVVDRKRPNLSDISDADILSLVKECFEATANKVRRDTEKL